MTIELHDLLCKKAANELFVNWNDFDTSIIDDKTILITLDDSNKKYLVSEFTIEVVS